MSEIEELLLVVGSLAVAAGARRLRLSAPLVLVAVGLVVSYLPGVPDIEINPQLVLVLFMPPLLYSASLGSSYLGFRANLRPIGLLSVGLVLATTVAVGFVAHLLIPALPLTSALVLGAVVAPPDAVAAVAIGRRLGLPRRLMTLMTGESLVNDATALTAFKVAVAAALGMGASWGAGVRTFLVASVGGVVIGLALAMLVHAIRMRLHDSVVESALGMVVPFAAYLIADIPAIGASGVLAVVTAGLYLGHNAPRAGYATRLQEDAVWRAIDVLLESLVFGLIGLNLRFVLHQVNSAGHSTIALLAASIGVLAAAILVRIAWIYPATYLPRWVSRLFGRGRDDPLPPWQQVAVLSWSGMRGVVSLAAAASVPAAVPGRDLVLLLAFAVTVGTLLIQGLSLPWLIRRLGVHGNDDFADTLAEAQAAHNASLAAVSRLDELTNDEDDTTPAHVVAKLRMMGENSGNAAWERLGRQEIESPAAAYRRLRMEMLDVQRGVYLDARNSGEIDDEVLRKVLRELDLEQARLDARD
ncbi:MAG TPA: Na+/H+ antiporter [Pseudonocardiaceae bacterium]|nr:Na+/H+ antiporter [Pseudonocardiaceae bacterium]